MKKLILSYMTGIPALMIYFVIEICVIFIDVLFSINLGIWPSRKRQNYALFKMLDAWADWTAPAKGEVE